MPVIDTYIRKSYFSGSDQRGGYYAGFAASTRFSNCEWSTTRWLEVSGGQVGIIRRSLGHEGVIKLPKLPPRNG